MQFATFIGYFVFAIPASLFMRRFGYRAAVVMGLVLFGAGALLFYPRRSSASTTGSSARCSWSRAGCRSSRPRRIR